MTTPRLLSVAAVLASLLAAPGALAFDPTGQVSFHVASGLGGSASFDADRVVGPGVNVSREEGAGWTGDLNGTDLALEVLPDKLRAAGVSLSLARKPGELKVEGLVFGQRVRFELTGKVFSGRYGVCSFDLASKTPGVYRGDVGCMKNGTSGTGTGVMRLTGAATLADPPMPQLVLALLAVLPG